jgi:adenine-specific DNA-methyltransferase
LPRRTLEAYLNWTENPDVVRLGDAAKVGIGYVTGDNDFFHLRPSQARTLGIPDKYLVASVRRSSFLPIENVTASVVATWLREDEPVLLLRLPPSGEVLGSIVNYLNSADGRRARTTYKCRNRSPWYSVPDVHIPDAFLAYMSGGTPKLVANSARCVCTNSIHLVRMKNGFSVKQLMRRWAHPLVDLSCELEGHPLGGGMLKLEPTEAARVILPPADLTLTRAAKMAIEEGIRELRRWRHYA